AEVYAVSVLDHVLLPLDAQLSRFAALGLTLERDEIFPAHHFGADEAALDVGVNLAGRTRRQRSARHRPGAAFVLAIGEHGDEIDELECGVQKAGPCRLPEPE